MSSAAASVSKLLLKKEKKKLKRKEKKIKKRLVGTGQKLGGHGAYSLSDIVGAVAKPFVDDTASVGVVNKTARTIGNVIGDAIGIPGASRFLGNAASYFARLLGSGKYTASQRILGLKNNSVLKGVDSGFITNSMPLFNNGEGGSIRITHREYISDVASSVNFANILFYINPGNSFIFPWLSRLALNYEEYKFSGLVFEYKSTSATAVGTVTSGMGTVMMATDYDAADNSFVSKRAMESSEYATSGAPYENQCHPIECADSTRLSLNNLITSSVTPKSLPNNTDLHLYFPALFSLGTIGQQVAGDTIGELWVTYDVWLKKPTLEPNSNSSSFTQHVTGAQDSTGQLAIGSNNFSASPFGVSLTNVPATSNKITLVATQGLVGGTYLISFRVTSSSAAFTANPLLGGPQLVGNVTLLQNFVNSAGMPGFISYDGAYSPSTNIMSRTINYETICIAVFGDTVGTLSFYLPFSAGGATNWDLIITAYNNSISETENVTIQNVNKTVEDLTKRVDRLIDLCADNISKNKLLVNTKDMDDSESDKLKAKILEDYEWCKSTAPLTNTPDDKSPGEPVLQPKVVKESLMSLYTNRARVNDRVSSSSSSSQQYVKETDAGPAAAAAPRH